MLHALELFDRVKDAPQRELIGDEFQITQADIRSRLVSAREAYAKHQKEYNTCKAEVIKALQGESCFSTDILNELLNSSKAGMDAAEREIDQRQKELANSDIIHQDVQQKYDNILTWADLYNNATMAAKRMIMSQLINAVHVKRDYELEIDFNIAYEQYCMGFYEKGKF